jgi:hypothetical protein
LCNSRFASWEDLVPEQRQSYWIAANRARQMLAVLTI